MSEFMSMEIARNGEVIASLAIYWEHLQLVVLAWAMVRGARRPPRARKLSAANVGARATIRLEYQEPEGYKRFRQKRETEK